jgi:hypothetical protein
MDDGKEPKPKKTKNKQKAFIYDPLDQVMEKNNPAIRAGC